MPHSIPSPLALLSIHLHVRPHACKSSEYSSDFKFEFCSLIIIGTCTLVGDGACIELTPSQQHEEPPFPLKIREHHHQHEVEHDPLTHHPAEGRQEEVLDQSCHCITCNLKYVQV